MQLCEETDSLILGFPYSQHTVCIQTFQLNMQRISSHSTMSNVCFPIQKEEKRGPPLPATLCKLYLVTSTWDEALGETQEESRPVGNRKFT